MWSVVDATKRVSGVRAVAQELTVRALNDLVRDDAQIAMEAQRGLAWDAQVPSTVVATVRQGLVQLDGQVTWDYPRNAAERAIRDLAGVVGANAAWSVPGVMEVVDHVQLTMTL
jgi:osmotically-inducible protein OsmY